MIIDFRKCSIEPNYVNINDSIVERESSYKYLGVVLDNQLAWHDHIENLMKNQILDYTASAN